MKITLKDGSIKEYSEAMSAYDITRDISEGLARAACAVEINGEVKDLRTVIDEDCELNVLTAKDADGNRASYLFPCAGRSGKETLSKCQAGNRTVHRRRILL